MNICSIGKVYENASVGCWRGSGTSWQPTKLQCVSSTKRLSGATNSRLSLPGAVPLNSSSIVAAPARYRSRIQCITNSVADLASRSLRLRLFTQGVEEHDFMDRPLVAHFWLLVYSHLKGVLPPLFEE